MVERARFRKIPKNMMLTKCVNLWLLAYKFMEFWSIYTSLPITTKGPVSNYPANPPHYILQALPTHITPIKTMTQQKLITAHINQYAHSTPLAMLPVNQVTGSQPVESFLSRTPQPLIPAIKVSSPSPVSQKILSPQTGLPVQQQVTTQKLISVKVPSSRLVSPVTKVTIPRPTSQKLLTAYLVSSPEKITTKEQFFHRVPSPQPVLAVQPVPTRKPVTYRVKTPYPVLPVQHLTNPEVVPEKIQVPMTSEITEATEPLQTISHSVQAPPKVFTVPEEQMKVLQGPTPHGVLPVDEMSEKQVMYHHVLSPMVGPTPHTPPTPLTPLLPRHHPQDPKPPKAPINLIVKPVLPKIPKIPECKCDDDMNCDCGFYVSNLNMQL